MMNLFKIFQKKHHARSFKAAKINRLTNEWITSPIQINADLKNDLDALKTRCREAAKNNPHMRKFIRMREVNIIGNNPINLICDVKDYIGKQIKPDIVANEIIERVYSDFSKKDYFTVTGTHSRRDVEKIIVASMVYDGEFFCRLIRNNNTKYNFAIQIIDPYLCDIKYNIDLANGNKVINGIEIDSFGKPVSYFFLKCRPDTYNIYTERFNVPAEEIIHIFNTDFIGQTRGIPLAASGLLTLNELSAYTEAEITAARIAASKMGFYTIPRGDNIDSLNNTDKDGATVTQEVSPGMLEALPEGWDFKNFNPEHPTGNHSEFVKSTLREVANAFGVSYPEFANDLEGVNYSSIRQGVLFERDCWKDEQQFIIDHFETRVFNKFLEINLLNGNLAPLPYSKLDKFRNCDKWMARGFAWVDPEKDQRACELAIANGSKTYTQVASEQGGDFEDNIRQIAKEKALAESLGIELGPQDNNNQYENIDKEPIKEETKDTKNE